MKVIVNKREKIMPENISIAVNEEVISQTKWEETKLKDGDKITIIQATCGG